MRDHRLARPWTDVRPQIKADGGAYELRETRSPRDFFAVDETLPYVVRAQESGGPSSWKDVFSTIASSRFCPI